VLDLTVIGFLYLVEFSIAKLVKLSDELVSGTFLLQIESWESFPRGPKLHPSPAAGSDLEVHRMYMEPRIPTAEPRRGANWPTDSTGCISNL